MPSRVALCPYVFKDQPELLEPPHRPSPFSHSPSPPNAKEPKGARLTSSNFVRAGRRLGTAAPADPRRFSPTLSRQNASPSPLGVSPQLIPPFIHRKPPESSSSPTTAKSAARTAAPSAVRHSSIPRTWSIHAPPSTFPNRRLKLFPSTAPSPRQAARAASPLRLLPSTSSSVGSAAPGHL